MAGRTGPGAIAALLAVIGLAVVGCGSAERPVDLAPVTAADRPLPADVGGVSGERKAPDPASCDATRSLAPQGGITPGSTMDEIRKRGILRVGVDQNNFLFGFRNPTSGQLEGFDIDIAKQIASAIFGDPNRILYRTIPSAQREDVLAKHDVDIVVRTYTIDCNRIKKVNFSSVYYTAGQRVLVPERSTATGLGDLGGKRVCATKRSTSLAAINEHPAHPVPVSVDDWSDCLVLMQQGQVDAVSTDDVILAGMKGQDPRTKVVGERFSNEPYGVGIPKGNEDMVRFVNAVLEQVRAGPWQASYNKWVAPHLQVQAQPPAPLYK